MADEIRSKKIELTVVADTKQAQRAATDLEATFNSLMQLTRDSSVSSYWKNQATLINMTTAAFKKYNKVASEDNAKELLKTTNALKALSGGVLPDGLQDVDKIKQTVLELSHIDPGSNFSVESFEKAFRSLKLMNEYGLNTEKIFSKFNIDTSSFDELEQKAKNADGIILSLRNRIDVLSEELRNSENGNGIADLKEELSELQHQLDYVRRDAQETFEAFLKANNLVEGSIDSYGFVSYDFNDDKFQKYFDALEEGSMNAQQAIAAFRREYSYLFEENGSFDSIQLQDFSKQLDEILRKTTEVSEKIEKLSTDGVKVNESANTENLEQLTSAMSELGNSNIDSGLNSVYENLAKVLSIIKEIGQLDSDNLYNITAMIKGLSRLNDLKINKASLENLADCLERICDITDTSSITSLSTLELSKFNDLHISKASLNNLATYLPEIANINVGNLKELTSINFENLNGLDGKSLSALKEFVSELQKSMSSSTPSTESADLNKVQQAAQEAATAKESFVSANEKVASSVDGSVSKLQEEAALFDQIAKNAKEAAESKNTFSDTNKKVTDSAEKTDEKVKSEREGMSSGISGYTKNTKDDFETIMSLAKSANKDATESIEKWKLLSQQGRVGDDSFSAKFQKNNGQTEDWYFKRNDKGTYDIQKYLSTDYAGFEKEIISAENKLRDLQQTKLKILSKSPNASTSGIDAQINAQQEYVNLLDKTAQYLRNNNETLLQGQQIEVARNKAAEEYYLKQGTKDDVKNANALAKAEESRAKNIEQSNRLLNRYQIRADATEATYTKIPGKDRYVSNTNDLSELSKKKNEIQSLISKLNDQGRNSSNEKEYLELEKLIAEYQRLAQEKLKANNPSQQKLGGTDLAVAISEQVKQYNDLIAKSEKYGDVTSHITEELKAQRDLIAEKDQNGIYVARKKKTDGSEFTADDYYSARDIYKIKKSEFGSYEKAQKEQSAKNISEAKQLKNDWDTAVQALKEYEAAVSKLNTLKASDYGKNQKTNEIEDQEQKVKELIPRFKQAQEIIEHFTLPENFGKIPVSSWGEFVDVIKRLETASNGSSESIAKLNDAVGNFKASTMKSIDDDIKKYQNQVEKSTKNSDTFKMNEGYQKAINNLKKSIDELEKVKAQLADKPILSKEDITSLEEAQDSAKKASQAVQNFSSAAKGMKGVSIEREIQKINQALEQNPRYSKAAKEALKELIRELESGISTKGLDEIHQKLLQIQNDETKAGRSGKGLIDVIKEKQWYGLASQIAGMVSLYDVINVFKEAASTVTQLNSDITDLAKVSEASTSQIYKDFSSYANIAKDIGGTISDTISATAAWAKNGYNIPDSKELARVSQLYKNVGDNIDIDTANESLISTLKGFNMEADQAEHIVDIFNEVSNNEAISSSGIGDALQRSAAAFNAANTSLEKSVALITATRQKELVEYMETYIENIFNCHRSLYYCIPQYRGNYYITV